MLEKKHLAKTLFAEQRTCLPSAGEETLGKDFVSAGEKTLGKEKFKAH